MKVHFEAPFSPLMSLNYSMNNKQNQVFMKVLGIHYGCFRGVLVGGRGFTHHSANASSDIQQIVLRCTAMCRTLVFPQGQDYAELF